MLVVIAFIICQWKKKTLISFYGLELLFIVLKYVETVFVAILCSLLKLT